MAKPSVVLASLAIIFGVGLLVIEGVGLGLFLGKNAGTDYNNDTEITVENFTQAGALTAFFVPFLGILVILLGSVSLCCLASSDPSRSGRTLLGCCWFTMVLLMLGGIAVCVLYVVYIELLELFFDVCNDCEISSTDAFGVGKYLAIACAAVCGIVAICGIALCCLGCCCQRADEDEETMVVRVI